MRMDFEEISPREFLQWHEEGDKETSVVMDVRELFEWQYYHLDDTLHMPMNKIPEKLEELPRDRTIYVICAHGVRSYMVCDYLSKQGFDVTNVAGGMSAVAQLRGFYYD
jgi:rhodanese-related sulfurtransferase